MRMIIEELNTNNLNDVNKCDNEFIIDSKLVLHLENDEIRYTMLKLPVTRKRYEVDNYDFSTYIDSPGRVVFLAYVEGQIAGQIILRANWNRFAYIEDITVDVRYRRHGVGRELISRAKRWAEEHHLAGLMLETQDNNVGACRFYECCGFKLRGFDSCLYKGLDRVADEVALYWYLLFREAQSA